MSSVKFPQFSNTKARAAARQDAKVNWPATRTSTRISTLKWTLRILRDERWQRLRMDTWSVSLRRAAARVATRQFGSANGNRTRESGSRPLPSITGKSFLVRVLAFLSPGYSLRIPASFAESVRRPLEEQPLRHQGRHGPTFASRNSTKSRRSQKTVSSRASRRRHELGRSEARLAPRQAWYAGPHFRSAMCGSSRRDSPLRRARMLR